MESAESASGIGVKENFDDFDYDDYGLLFEVIWSQDAEAEDMTLWWLDHGYPESICGGKRHIGLLHAAASHGMPRVIEKVLDMSAGWVTVDDQDYDGNTPLWYAANAGQTECVKTLLRLGANVHGLEGEEQPEPDRCHDTPLHVAGNAEIAELLLDAGASFDIPCYSDGYIAYNFDPRFKIDRENLSPVTTAVVLGHMDVARILLERGARLEDQALRYLALGDEDESKAKPEDAIELINLGLSPDGEPGKEPLRIAARSGNAEFCRILLKMGAKPLPQALTDAVRSGDLETVKVFLQEGIGERAEALRLTAKRIDKKIVDFMMEAYPDLADACFMGAIEGCDFRTARKLLGSANLNYRDETGKTPLIALYQ